MTTHLRAALLMTLGMASFACEDAMLKLLTQRIPTGQLMLVVGAVGALIFAAGLARQGKVHWRHLWHPRVLLRDFCEGLCGLLFLTALSLGDLGTASAIIQMLPLLMTLGGALLLGEAVGLRRWLSVALGFCGVMLILRPGSDAFAPASLLALAAVVVLAGRELVTRRLPAEIGSGVVTVSAYAAIAVTGAAVMIAGGQAPVMPDAGEALGMLACVGLGLLGYITMVVATRLADLSAIAPFRYSRLIFAIGLGMAVFGERPDAAMLSGAALIAAAGGYTMWREARQRRVAGSMIRPGGAPSP